MRAGPADQIIQGMGGLMSVTGHAGGGPLRAGLAVADCGTGIYAAVGILLALLERERSGEGQWVQLAACPDRADGLPAARYLNEGDTPAQAGNDHPTSSPMGLFEASDGAFNLGASGEGNWKRLCDCLNAPQWLQDPRYATEKLRVANRAPLNEALARALPGSQRGPLGRAAEPRRRAGRPGLPIPQVFEDEQVRHLGVAQSVTGDDGQAYRLISQPVTLTRTPPPSPGPRRAGASTDEMLAEAGYDAAGIARLRAGGRDRRVLAGRRPARRPHPGSAA